LTLATAKGNSIQNYIEGPPTAKTIRLWMQHRSAHQWTERKPDTGIYNCAGLVWASRRTSIDDQFSMILADDGYRPLRPKELPAVGDLVLYLASTTEGVEVEVHVGVIVALDPGIAEASQPIPRILSKWDSTSGEFLHYPNDHPFTALTPRIEYRTDRP
jgi:hypothetical protein